MTIVPIKELKDGAAISAKCREVNEPIHITKNGYGDMVIMSTEVFERYQAVFDWAAKRELERQKELDETVAAIQQGMRECEAGEYADAFEFLAELEAEYAEDVA